MTKEMRKRLFKYNHTLLFAQLTILWLDHTSVGGADSFRNIDSVRSTKGVFSLKESDFSRLDESRFIGLQLDYSVTTEEAKPHLKMGGGRLKGSESLFGSMRGSDLVAHEYGAPQFGDGIFSHSGCCRITVNERGIKRGRRNFKGGWKWILRHHPSRGSSTRRKKEEEDMIFKT